MSEAAKPNVNTRMPKGAKRPKSLRACLACRKLKARCEPAAGAKPRQVDHPQSSTISSHICHRCKTLCIDCLYETPEGHVIKAKHTQQVSPIPSPAQEHKKAPRYSKRSRADDHNGTHPFTNDPAIFLSPAISPSALTRSIYRDIEICSLNTVPSTCLERPVLASTAFSSLIGTNPTLKRDAQHYLLSQTGAFGPASLHSWKQAPPDLCAGKAAARLMSAQTHPAPYPREEIKFLNRFLQPHEHHLRILFQGLYGAFSPFLSTPFQDSLSLATCQSDAQCFTLLAIYLAALPHIESTQPIGSARKPLRKAVDAFLRRAIHSPLSDHLNIFALHTCASFLLLPVDGMVEDHRPVPTPEQENDGLLEYSLDLNPRAAIIVALSVAQTLGYASLAAKLPSIRQRFESESPQNHHTRDPARDQYAHAVLCTFTWLTLLQLRVSIDVAEDRIEWDSLAQFEHDITRIRIDATTSALLPPPTFLSPREQSRCCWSAQRAELYTIARDHRHTKRVAAAFTKKEAEEQAMGYKKALDQWRYKFNEQMRSLSFAFRKDPRGLGLHRYYSIFSNAEAQSLQVSIGSVYHKEFVADMRQRLAEPFYTENVPWKSATTIMLGHEEDLITKAILINFAYTDAMLKALGLLSSLTPVMPQLYDFVSYEETAGSEIPSLCIVALPILQAGLFAVPLLAAADLRLSVIETWGASASYFNHHLLPLLTNCVKSLRSCHVTVNLPGIIRMPFTTANSIADYLQGPFEILMRKVASVEERLQISHVESILTNAFFLSSKKKEIETLAEELAPEAPEMVQAIADSQKLEDEISASMMGSLRVQAIQEIEDTEYAVKVFGADLREGDVRPIKKAAKNASIAAATTPDAQASRKANSNIRSDSMDSEQTGSPSNLTNSSKQRNPMHRSVRSIANASQFSSPGSSIQSAPSLRQESRMLSKEAAQPQINFEGQMQEPMYSAAPGYVSPPMQASHPQQPALTYQPAMQQTIASDPPYSSVYSDRNGPPHLYMHNNRLANPTFHQQDVPPYVPLSAAEHRYAHATIVGKYFSNDTSNGDAYGSYRSNSEMIQPEIKTQGSSGYENLQRPYGDVKNGSVGCIAGNPHVSSHLAATGSGSDAWSHPQHSQYGEPQYPNDSIYVELAQSKLNSYVDVCATSRQAEIDSASGAYYQRSLVEQKNASYAEPQYQTIDYRSEEAQQPLQLALGGSGTMDDHYSTHAQAQAQARVQAQGDQTIWDTRNFDNSQQPQHSHYHHHHYRG
ncbi:uncharacterized protein MEPE_00189 [Melanopsichium pennsylvanicum]|uniref:Zn(2)-C6 fungal-type domain-containing protein n=2 Tax=Melanopsichium pennsylvanicum TaxID=63383 RepID=A0AAJ4XFL4_9BASI|nr:putative protein [Melanopsichium pennsylvanicum 4]SNX81484.1 uncharacterized protein MEPE_00189 [Melanopsichium pennsylvanicum]